MNLRARLLISYMVFVCALAAVGGWSVWHLREMGEVTQHIVVDNYDDVVAVQNMMTSIGRQDSAVLMALLGQKKEALARLAYYRQRFDASLQKAANRITEPGEAEIFESVRRGRQMYYLLVDAMLVAIDQSDSSVRTHLGPKVSKVPRPGRSASSARARFQSAPGRLRTAPSAPRPGHPHEV